MRAVYVEASRSASRAFRRRARRIAGGGAGAPTGARRLVGVRLRIAVVESAVSLHRSKAGDLARQASPLLSLVARHRAARPRPRDSCWDSIRAAHVTASSIACRRECACAELALLWRREMVVGAYHPRWLRVRAGAHALTALAFVVDRRHPQYAGQLSLARQAEVSVARRRGLRLVGRLSRARARLADHARHRRSLSGSCSR